MIKKKKKMTTVLLMEQVEIPVLQRSIVLSWLVKPEDDSPLELMSTLRCGSNGSSGRCPVPYLHISWEQERYLLKDFTLHERIKLAHKCTNTKANVIDLVEQRQVSVSLWHLDGGRTKHFFRLGEIFINNHTVRKRRPHKRSFRQKTLFILV